MCALFQQKLEEAELFTQLWIDNNYMKDNMFKTVSTAISQSKVVFVLLSDNYCKSDFCRREWHYAIGEQIRIYVIIVQKDFDKQKYDWVRFSVAGEFYYKMHNNDQIPKLIRHVDEFLNRRTEREATPALPPSSSSSPSKPKTSTSNREYIKKTSITTWTSEDIQHWCYDNHLEKWSKPLTHFDGNNLLVLREDLSNDSYVQYIVKGNDLNGFDIARFKSEIDKLLSIPKKTESKILIKKHVRKRRISKSGAK